MTLQELQALFWVEVEDVKEPHLWSAELVASYANDAVLEAARRARLLVDSSTKEVVQYAVKANVAMIELHKAVLFARRAKLASASSPLAMCSYRDLDAGMPGWETSTGTPRAVIQDLETGKLRLYPIPDAADTLNLTVTRIPLCPMVEPEDCPEISEAYHIKLIDWMKYRAYMRRDEDTFDEKRALTHLKLFETEFGPPRPAIEEQWQSEQYHGDPFDGAMR